MISYFKWIAFFFLLTLESIICFICSLFHYYPSVDLSSWVVIKVEIDKISEQAYEWRGDKLAKEESYRKLSSEAYDGVNEDE